MPLKETPDLSALLFLSGGGGMGELIRSLDWTSTPLGAPAGWPSVLKHTVSMMLGSAFPTLICWGDEYVQLYNDAFRPINGKDKHPEALGGKASNTYAEIWEEIGPMFRRVMHGETISIPNFMVQLDRNGYKEDCYFDFSYSPIKDEDGQIRGILVICLEMTEKINALKELEEKHLQQQESMMADANNQRKLIEADSNLRSIIVQAPVAMAIFRGADYVVEIANGRALELWGRKEKDVKGKPILQTMPELESQGIRALLDDVFINGNSFSAKELPVVLMRNGKLETVYVNFVYDPLYDAEGHITGVVTIGSEVTESVLTRKKIENSESKLDQVIDLLPAAITILIGPDFIVERTNPTNLAYWKKTREQVFGKPLLDVLPELQGQAFPGQLKHVLESGETVVVTEGEVKLKLDDGSISLTYVDYSYQPLTDQNGERIGVLVMSNDVTDKVESRLKLESSEAALQATNEEFAASLEELTVTNEELAEAQALLQQSLDRLTESEEQMRTLVAAAPFPIGVYIGREMRIAQANQAIMDVWGKGNDVVGKTYYELLPELEGQNIYPVLDGVFTSGIPFSARNQRVDLTVDGKPTVFYFNYNFTPLVDNNGQVYGVMNTAADITDLNLALQKIERSEQNFRSVIEQAPAAMCLLSGPEHVIELVNTAMLEIWGKFMPDVINKPVFEALPDARDQGLEFLMKEVYRTGESFIANEQPVSLVRYGQPDVVYQNFIYQPYFNSDGETLGILAISTDVTEQVLARRKLEESEAELLDIKNRLEAELEAGKLVQQQKDGFIGMASHELKTPLTSLSAIIQVASMKLKNSDEPFLSGAMDKASAQIKRMNGLINGFLNISRLESGQIRIDKSDFDVNTLLSDVVSEHQLTVSTHQLDLKTTGDHVTIRADREKIGSVISNLLSNAVKYSPKGGHVYIKCEVVNDEVLVSIKDDGIGISGEDLTKVFDRYYRVEAEFTEHISGFGIGLYLSADIIHRHKGKIWVESEPGQGATFFFSLPITA